MLQAAPQVCVQGEEEEEEVSTFLHARYMCAQTRFSFPVYFIYRHCSYITILASPNKSFYNFLGGKKMMPDDDSKDSLNLSNFEHTDIHQQDL